MILQVGARGSSLEGIRPSLISTTTNAGTTLLFSASVIKIDKNISKQAQTLCNRRESFKNESPDWRVLIPTSLVAVPRTRNNMNQ